MVNRYRIPINLNETQLILATLAVASGASVDNAIACIRLSAEDAALPWCTLDLSTYVAMWGCVFAKEIAKEQAAEIEAAAKEQYPNWQSVKKRVAKEAREGRL